MKSFYNQIKIVQDIFKTFGANPDMCRNGLWTKVGDSPIDLNWNVSPIMFDITYQTDWRIMNSFYAMREMSADVDCLYLGESDLAYSKYKMVKTWAEIYFTGSDRNANMDGICVVFLATDEGLFMCFKERNTSHF